MTRVLLASLLLAISIPLHAGERTVEFGFFYRDYDSDVFGNADGQGGLVARFDFGGKFFRPAVGLSFSGTESRNEFALFQPFDDESSVFELSGGFLVSRFDKSFRPYLGAGLSGSWIRVERLQSPSVVLSDRDFASGFYVRTGFVRRSRKDPKISFGVDLHYQAGQSIEILGQTGDSDFFQIGFVMGFRI